MPPHASPSHIMQRILVIDDDPDVRALIEQMLTGAGYEVVLAVEGREGVAQHRASPVDLVITDLYMPTQEGLETIAQLRKHFPDVKIIAMSGKTAASAMLPIAQRLGAVEVLNKPFLPDEFLAAVKRALA